MDTFPMLAGILCLTLAAVTFHAWRLGNEKRDVALLGASVGCLGWGRWWGWWCKGCR